MSGPLDHASDASDASDADDAADASGLGPSQAAAEAFTRHWIRCQPNIAAYIRSLVPQMHDAEDLLQNVAVVMLRKFAQYDPERPFLHWALGIARNEALGHRRSHATQRLVRNADLAEVLADACEEVAPEMDERLGALSRCQENLQPRAREVLRLRYQDALSPPDIATRMKMSHGAVRVALTRARAALMACIERGRAAIGLDTLDPSVDDPFDDGSRA